MSNFTDLPL